MAENNSSAPLKTAEVAGQRCSTASVDEVMDIARKLRHAKSAWDVLEIERQLKAKIAALIPDVSAIRADERNRCAMTAELIGEHLFSLGKLQARVIASDIASTLHH